MKKTILLLAGYPGTGKSYLANKLMERFPGFEELSPDELKEKYWDEYGFVDLEEKEKLILLSWKEYYREMEDALSRGQSLISDYPFSGKQKDRIEELRARYGFQVITIRLTGDLEVLFERQAKRDLNTDRHPGHVMKSYHKGGVSVPRENADNLLDHAEFIKRCEERGYGTFSLGRTFEIDVTDYNAIDYDALFAELTKALKENEQ